MSIEVKTPVFPESITEGSVATWHKVEGDSVSEGETIVEIETDKVVMEVPAPASGILGNIIKKEGDTVESEEVLATIGEEKEVKNIKSQSANEENKPKAQKIIKNADTSEVFDIKTPTFPESISEGTIATWHKKPGDHVSEDEVIVEIETDKVVMEVPSPKDGVLQAILKQEGDTVLNEEVIGSIAIGDVKSIETKAKSQAQETVSSSDQPHLSPSVRRAVKENDLDIANVQGTGKGGRITKQDLNTPNLSSPKAKSQSSKPIELTGDRIEKRVKMTRLRKTVAKRLVEVQHTNAILTTFNEVDMKPVMDLRKKYKDLFVKEHGAKLGFMSFFLKASVEALKRFPEVNASIDGDDIVYHGFFDIGVAVGSDRGLVVPVIRNADSKSYADIESEIVEKAMRARDGKLSLEEMQGGTFTITNGGTYGSMLSTPIINAPQSAILGMHNIVERPVVQNGEIVVRPIMYLALSYDHRIIDGSVSVRFLKTIKEMIEDPARLLLQV